MDKNSIGTVLLVGLGLIFLGFSQWKKGYKVTPIYIGIYISVVVFAWVHLFFSGPDGSGARGLIEMIVTFGGFFLVFIFSFIEMIVLFFKRKK